MRWLRQLHRCGFPTGRQPMALQRSPLSDPLSGKHAAPPRSIGIGGLLRAIGLSPSISPSLSPQPNPSPKPSLSPLPSPQGNPCGHSNGDLNGKLHGTGNGISSGTSDGPNGPDRTTAGEPQVLFRLVGNSLVMACGNGSILTPSDHAQALLAFLQADCCGLWIAAKGPRTFFLPSPFGADRQPIASVAVGGARPRADHRKALQGAYGDGAMRERVAAPNTQGVSHSPPWPARRRPGPKRKK